MPRQTGTGVYKILNVVNGKFYLGSCSTSFGGRWTTHRGELRRGVHCNRHLQRAWNKYGEGSFLFLVVERCPGSVCLIREQHYLDTLTPWDDRIGYNLGRKSDAPMFNRKHSAESRAKMSASQKASGNPGQPKATAAAAIANRGRKKSENFCKNLSEIKKGVPLTESHRAAVKTNHWTKRPDAKDIIERSAAKHRGKKHTKEHKEKIGNSHWKNRPDAAEIAKRVAESVSKAQKGRHYSPETIRNMRLGQKRRRATARGEIRPKPLSSPEESQRDLFD